MALSRKRCKFSFLLAETKHSAEMWCEAGLQTEHEPEAQNLNIEPCLIITLICAALRRERHIVGASPCRPNGIRRLHWHDWNRVTSTGSFKFLSPTTVTARLPVTFARREYDSGRVMLTYRKHRVDNRDGPAAEFVGAHGAVQRDEAPTCSVDLSESVWSQATMTLELGLDLEGE